MVQLVELAHVGGDNFRRPVLFTIAVGLIVRTSCLEVSVKRFFFFFWFLLIFRSKLRFKRKRRERERERESFTSLHSEKASATGYRKDSLADPSLLRHPSPSLLYQRMLLCETVSHLFSRENAVRLLLQATSERGITHGCSCMRVRTVCPSSW